MGVKGCSGVRLAGVLGWVLLATMVGAQGIPAPSQGAGGAPAGQGAATRQSPAAVPQASQTQLPTDGTRPVRTPLDDLKGLSATGLSTSLVQWRGLRVDRVLFEGVTFGPKETLPNELAQKAGQPLDHEKARERTRRLFGSGRYRDITV
ncbi:MAG: hypothetical protein NVSMB3_07280 [Acidobacteriaceae bacterium]